MGPVAYVHSVAGGAGDRRRPYLGSGSRLDHDPAAAGVGDLTATGDEHAAGFGHQACRSGAADLGVPDHGAGARPELDARAAEIAKVAVLDEGAVIGIQ